MKSREETYIRLAATVKKNRLEAKQLVGQINALEKFGFTAIADSLGNQLTACVSPSPPSTSPEAIKSLESAVEGYNSCKSELSQWRGIAERIKQIEQWQQKNNEKLPADVAEVIARGYAAVMCCGSNPGNNQLGYALSFLRDLDQSIAGVDVKLKQGYYEELASKSTEQLVAKKLGAIAKSDSKQIHQPSSQPAQSTDLDNKKPETARHEMPKTSKDDGADASTPPKLK